MNALQFALAEWAGKDVEPPASVYPRLADGQLAANTKEAMGFPDVPGGPSPTGLAVGVFDCDFGPALNYNDFSGVIGRQPPAIRRIIPALMPKVNADGNEVAGIASVLHQAPLGTYTGWNVTAGGFFKGRPRGGGLTGGYIPVPGRSPNDWRAATRGRRWKSVTAGRRAICASCGRRRNGRSPDASCRSAMPLCSSRKPPARTSCELTRRRRKRRKRRTIWAAINHFPEEYTA